MVESETENITENIAGTVTSYIATPEGAEPQMENIRVNLSQRWGVQSTELKGFRPMT